MSLLRKHDKCPIHHSFFCCGREQKKTVPRKVQRKGPVTKLEDGRELCSPSEMRRRKLRKLMEQEGRCGGCGSAFDHIREAQTHHIRARGMGNAFRDDSMANLIELCAVCHSEVHSGNRVI